MPELEIDITPPYDFELSLKFSTTCRFDIVSGRSGPKLVRAVMIDKKATLLDISWNGRLERPKIRVAWQCPGGGRIRPAEVAARVKRWLGAELELIPFYRMAGQSPEMKSLIGRFRGLKPILTPTVFEAAAWAIMGQQVNLNFAHTLKNRLSENYGHPFNLNGNRYVLFPTPAILSRARLTRLRRLQFSTRKAEYLVGLAGMVARDELDIEKLDDHNYPSGLERLLTVRGLGVWSANYILMRGAGLADCLPLGDSGLHRAIEKLYDLESRPDNEQVTAMAEPFRPYRSLCTLYLWNYLMEA